jgi:hypothetical protein
MSVLDIAISHPLAVLAVAIDEAIATTGARNAAVALAEEHDRRRRWQLEERGMRLAPSSGPVPEVSVSA